MTVVIAERELELIRADGHDEMLIVQVRRPARDPTSPCLRLKMPRVTDVGLLEHKKR